MKRTGMFLALALLVSCGQETAPLVGGRSKIRPTSLGGETAGRNLQKGYACPKEASAERRSSGKMIDRIMEYRCFGNKSTEPSRSAAATPNVHSLAKQAIEEAEENN